MLPIYQIITTIFLEMTSIDQPKDLISEIHCFDKFIIIFFISECSLNLWLFIKVIYCASSV